LERRRSKEKEESLKKRDAPVLEHRHAPNQSRTGGATMAAKEVIHFPFFAQLASRSFFPVQFPREPVAESPPN
jgi:hypothetical protein